jgi:hypothetical protein
VLIDNVWCRVLLACDGQPAAVQAELLRRPATRRHAKSEQAEWPFYSVVVPTDLKSISWLTMPSGLSHRDISA